MVALDLKSAAKRWAATSPSTTLSKRCPGYGSCASGQRPTRPGQDSRSRGADGTGCAWTPDNDPAAIAYQPQIAPKWITKDGKSFWLVWTDFQTKAIDKDERQRILEEAKRVANHDDADRLRQKVRRYQPYYAFNTERADLVIA